MTTERPRIERRSRHWRRAALIAFSLAVPAPLSLAHTLPGTCFIERDNDRLSYDVVEMAPPPLTPDGKTPLGTSPYYPGSIFMSKSLSSMPMRHAGRGMKKYFLLWVNRCTYLRGITLDERSCRNMRGYKGNDSYGALRGDEARGRTALTDIRPAFSTYEKANTCTLIQASQVLKGEIDPAATNRARHLGLRVWRRTDHFGIVGLARAVTIGDGTTKKYLVDVCIMPTATAVPDLTGVFLDYEVADWRTPEEALAFLRRLADLVHGAGFKLGLAGNPIAPALTRVALMHDTPHGIGWTSAHVVLEIVDSYSIQLTTGAGLANGYSLTKARLRTMDPFENYRRSLAIVTQDDALPLPPALKAKLIWGVGLYDTSLAEAARLHDEIKRQGYQGVAIARALVPQGGPCSRPENQVIACLSMGSCTGRFGEDR